MTAFACYCGRKHVVQLLLDHSDPNFDWNARNNDRLIVFILACFNGHIDVVQLLLYLSKFSRLLFNKQHKMPSAVFHLKRRKTNCGQQIFES